MKQVWNKPVRQESKPVETELHTYLRHGVRVGSIVESNYGDKYVVSKVRPWLNAKPTLRGYKVNPKGKVLSEEINVWFATENGKIKVVND